MKGVQFLWNNMGSRILDFLKKNTTIRNRAIFLIYAIVVGYKFLFSLFQFSIVRFLKAGLDSNVFLTIGIFVAVANVIALLLDIPLGALQKYFKPRFFLLAAVALLLFSDLIFLLSSLELWLAFVAVLFQQISFEIYVVTVTTYILRLSGKEDYSQNMAQQDIADNTGDILGLGLGGLLFVIDRFFVANNLLVASFLALAITFFFIFIYEFVDRTHHSDLEKIILDQKWSQRLQAQATTITDSIVQHPEEGTSVADGTADRKINWAEIRERFGLTFTNLYEIFTSKIHAPLLLWAMVILIVSDFWYAAFNLFEPIFLKDIYQSGTGWIIDNVPRYIFESFMFIIALVIPTYFLELPFGKLADQWGKEKMILVGTFFSAGALLLLSIVQGPFSVFLIFLALCIGFVMVYPPVAGMIGEEYKKAVMSKRNLTSDISAQGEDEMLEGDSAGVIGIIVNIGEILASLVGGVLLQVFDFSILFTLFAFLLMLVGIGFVFFLKNNPLTPRT